MISLSKTIDVFQEAYHLLRLEEGGEKEYPEFRLRRRFVSIFNLIFNHRLPLRVIGELNKAISFIGSVSIVYAAAPFFKYAYAPESFHLEWNEFAIGGIFLEKGQKKLTLKVLVAADERGLRYQKNNDKIKQMYETILSLGNTFGIPEEELRFSGIIPSVLEKLKIRASNIGGEKVATSEAVFEAIKRILPVCNPPIILFGGRGYVGSAVGERLQGAGYELFVVDKLDEFPFSLKGRCVCLVNVSTPGAIKKYIPSLWPEAIYLHEVFPVLPKSQIDSLRKNQIKAYFVKGVDQSFSWPCFPFEYSGTIPCCAAHSGEHVRLMELT